MTQGVGGRGETADDLTPPGAREAAGSVGVPTPADDTADLPPAPDADDGPPPTVPRPALPPVFAPRSRGTAPERADVPYPHVPYPPAPYPPAPYPPAPLAPGAHPPEPSPTVTLPSDDGEPSPAGSSGTDLGAEQLLAGGMPGDAHGPDGHPAHRRRRVARAWRPVAIVLALATLLLLAGGVYLWRTSDAWQHRADDYERASHDLGVRLADERARLDATNADLEAVRDQLATAQSRIIELANEKAQLGDDREAQRMLADYQERVSEAAGRVAKALDQCVQGQNQLIGYLRNAALYDPKDLEAYSTSVQQLCQQATDANSALQGELSR